MKILSALQIRGWDEYTIQQQQISSYELMERAAQKCTGWLLKRFEGLKSAKIFCGKGNNGGDGLAIARQLESNGIVADVYVLELGSAGTDDFQANLHRLHATAVRIHFIQHTDFLPQLSQHDIVVDAMLGTGCKRPPEGLYADTVAHINNSNATVVSVDIPTGLIPDKATPGDIIIKATYTLTFQALKLAFLFPENENYTGEIAVLNIDLQSGFLDNVHSIFQLTDNDLIKHIYKPRKKFTNKGTYGHALIAAGEKGKMGAALLCTKACLAAGSGLVTALVPSDQFSILQTAAPEAMAADHSNVQNIEWNRYTTIGIGPGIGSSVVGMQLLEAMLTHFNKPVVADADALNIFSSNKNMLHDLPPASILTPHPKEFERLFGPSENHLERIHTARYYAQKLFVYIIIKGHYSVLACPDGEVYFNSTGNAGMATGGTGDVLTGILTGLLAQGYLPKDACILGMYLHGLSGDIAAAYNSQEALLAGDVVRCLGKAYLQVAKY